MTSELEHETGRELDALSTLDLVLRERDDEAQVRADLASCARILDSMPPSKAKEAWAVVRQHVAGSPQREAWAVLRPAYRRLRRVSKTTLPRLFYLAELGVQVRDTLRVVLPDLPPDLFHVKQALQLAADRASALVEGLRAKD